MSKILIFFKTYRLNLFCFTSLFFVSCFFILRAAPEVFGRLGYELHEIANWDTGMYYTIGKGLAHGITPYSGLYENKPPMIFLLSAISYKLTSGYYLVNILSFFSFLLSSFLFFSLSL
jgi:4-amino-4-deoxy-L-arabinose transferase-like glycosyltransferase